MTFPSEATAILINQLVDNNTHGMLGTVLLSAGLGDYDPGDKDKEGKNINKPSRLRMAITKAPPAVREKALQKLTIITCNSLASKGQPEWLHELVGELRAANLSLHAETSQVKENEWSDPTMLYAWQLGPLGADEIPITVQAGQLESLLIKNSLETAAGHYAQAFENFKAGNFESSNSQLRPALEETLLELTHRATNWTRTDKGGDAIEVLKGKKMFEEGEHDYFKGLWKISHANGSHPGMTTAADAEFRFHAITAAIYFLVHRYSKSTSAS